MSPIPLHRSVVAAKVESVEGTAETLTNSEGFLTFDANFDPAIDMHKRDPHRESLSPMIPLAGKRMAKITFKTELVGTASAGGTPFWGLLMRACGFAQTIVGGTSATYLPASTSVPSLTMAVYRDGKKKQIVGARGTFKLDLEVGKPGMVSWEFTGVDPTDTDVALLAPTYAAIVPPVLLSATFTLDSYAAIFAKLGIDFKNTIALRENPAKACGYVSAFITNREPVLTLDPEAVLAATKDWLDKWKTNAGVAMSLALGSVAGNTITITAPAVRITDMKEANRTQLLTDSITAILGLSSGDDELSIAIT